MGEITYIVKRLNELLQQGHTVHSAAGVMGIAPVKLYHLLYYHGYKIIRETRVVKEGEEVTQNGDTA